MRSKVAGGHAIMLRVRIPEELVRVAQDWVADKPDLRKLKIAEARPGWLSPDRFGKDLPFYGHVTLVFVGRDKKPEVGEKMLEAAKAVRFSRDVGRGNTAHAAYYLGNLDRFGFKKDHLAVHVRLSHTAGSARDELIDILAGKGIKLKDGFGDYTPHLTLATGEPSFYSPTWVNPVFDAALQVEGLEVKIGSNRTEFLPL